MSRIAWFHCFAGIGGDMALGALLDAGADEAAVRDHLGKLGVSGWQLDVTRVQRATMWATRAELTSDAATAPRRLTEIHDIVRGAGLPVEVRERALAVFDRVAAAEARAQGITPDAVALGDAGTVAAIVAVVGVCAALHVLGIDSVQASPIAQSLGGTSVVLPSAATSTLLIGVPTYGLDLDIELTPTGAALVSTLARAFGPLPALTTTAVGYGAGARDLPQHPNVAQVVIGEAGTDDSLGRGLGALLLEVNVDDASPDTLAHAISRLLDAGAHDAWLTPIVVQHGRAAATVHVVCDPALAARVADVLSRETGSPAVRGTRLETWGQVRDDAIVDVDGQPVRVRLAGGRVKVEHDDAAAAAWALGLPLRDVLARAEEAGRALK
jgi:pyridinium-3,5-bisthiocarboxylic acid mononucleotide nickel chelatase